MGYVQIPKDLSKIKTKVVFNLTKRQLIGFSISGFVGIPSYLYLYEKDGLVCEKYLRCICVQKFY